METSGLINHARTFILIFTPIALLTLIILPYLTSLSYSDQVKLRYRLGWAYTFFLCGIYWMFNILSISTTSFLPLFIFTLLGTMEAKELAGSILSSHNVLVFGSIALMVAVDNCGLVKRLSLAILKHSSGSIRWIFIDIYLATIWIAMWVNSCAAVFLIMKVIDEVLANLKAEATSGAMGEERLTMMSQVESTIRQQKESSKGLAAADVEATTGENFTDELSVTKVDQNEGNDDNGQQQPNRTVATIETFDTENEKLLNDFGGDLLFAVAVAANIGGLFWPFGSPMGFQIMRTRYMANDVVATATRHGLTDASWMIYSFPLLIANALNALAYLMCIHFGKLKSVKGLLVSKNQRITDFTQGRETLKRVGKIFADKHARLPIWNSKEIIVMVLTVLAILLCLTKHPVYITGWDELLQRQCKLVPKTNACTIISGIGDSIPYIIITLLIFIIPSWSRQTFKGPPPPGVKPNTTNILGWKKLQTTFPYTVLILIAASECIGSFNGRVSIKTVVPPISDFLTKTFDGNSTRVLTLIMMLFAASVSVFLPNPGTSILITELWYMMTSDYLKMSTKTNTEPVLIPGESLLPILSLACSCFVIPGSSVPTALAYGYKENKTLSAWYVFRLGLPLFFCILITTILYALLCAPNSLTVRYNI